MEATTGSTNTQEAGTLTLAEVERALKAVDPGLLEVPQIQIFENAFLTDAEGAEVPRRLWERLWPPTPSNWRRKTKSVVIQTPSKKVVVLDYRQLGMGNRIGIFCHPAAAAHLRRMIETLSNGLQNER